MEAGPEACEAIERWAKVAQLQPGDPIFRPIDKGQRIGPDRLWARSVERAAAELNCAAA